MKKTILTILAVLAAIIIITGIIVYISVQKYHDENTFADIEVTTKSRSLDPYQENYTKQNFSDTCIKGSVMELEPKDYTVTVMKVTHDGMVDVKINSRGGLWVDKVEYGKDDIITLHQGETKVFNEMVMDAEFIIEVKVASVYYR